MLATCHADPIYVIKRRDGSITFTSKPPPAGVEAKVFSAKKSGFSYYKVAVRQAPKKLSKQYRSLIHDVAEQVGVDRHLLTALIHAESGFDNYARSPKGAMGLTQLMPATARELGVRNAYEPRQNVSGGARHLARLIAKYRGQVRLALAAYNAGEEAVRRHGGIPPFTETQNYVRNVLTLYKAYQKASGSSAHG